MRKERKDDKYAQGEPVLAGYFGDGNHFYGRFFVIRLKEKSIGFIRRRS